MYAYYTLKNHRSEQCEHRGSTRKGRGGAKEAEASHSYFRWANPLHFSGLLYIYPCKERFEGSENPPLVKNGPVFH